MSQNLLTRVHEHDHGVKKTLLAVFFKICEDGIKAVFVYEIFRTALKYQIKFSAIFLPTKRAWQEFGTEQRAVICSAVARDDTCTLMLRLASHVRSILLPNSVMTMWHYDTLLQNDMSA